MIEYLGEAKLVAGEIQIGSKQINSLPKSLKDLANVDYLGNADDVLRLNSDF